MKILEHANITPSALAAAHEIPEEMVRRVIRWADEHVNYLTADDPHRAQMRDAFVSGALSMLINIRRLAAEDVVSPASFN